MRKCGKYSRVWQATDDSVAHAHCMVDTEGCKQTTGMCNTYCFPQQWLHERASIERYTYIACLVNLCSSCRGVF